MKTRCTGTTGGGYTMAGTRIKLGYRPAEATTDNPTTVDFLERLLLDGPYMIVERGGRKPSELARPYAKTEVFDYEFEAKLWIGFDPLGNNDVKNIEIFVENLCTAIENSTHSVSVGFDPPKIDTDRNPAVALFVLKISAIGC